MRRETRSDPEGKDRATGSRKAPEEEVTERRGLVTAHLFGFHGNWRAVGRGLISTQSSLSGGADHCTCSDNHIRNIKARGGERREETVAMVKIGERHTFQRDATEVVLSLVVVLLPRSSSASVSPRFEPKL